MNGRMSEYMRRGAWLARRIGPNVSREPCCRRSLGGAGQASGIRERFHLAPRIASKYALLDAGLPRAADDLLPPAGTEDRVAALNGNALHHEPYWRNAQRDSLPQTDRIAPSVVGLPMYCAPGKLMETSGCESRPAKVVADRLVSSLAGGAATYGLKRRQRSREDWDRAT
jgi:hypothetical protein